MSLWGPFFLGGMLALALNVPLCAVERRLPAKMRHRRKAALGAVLIFTASAVAILFAMVVPQLAESTVRLTKAAPQLWQRVQAALQRQFVRTPALKLILGGAESLNFEALVCRAAEKLRGAHWMGGTVDLAAQAAGWAADLGVGLVLAVYVISSVAGRLRGAVYCARRMGPNSRSMIFSSSRSSMFPRWIIWGGFSSLMPLSRCI